MNDQKEVIEGFTRQEKQISTKKIPNAIDEVVDPAVPIESDQKYASDLADIRRIERILSLIHI